MAAITLGSFGRVNTHKTTGPDGIPGCRLQSCTDPSAGVLKDIFCLSLCLLQEVCHLFVSNHNKATCLIHWRPATLSSIISKCFEKHVRTLICTILPTTLDPLQNGYHCNRSLLHYTLPSHEEDEDLYENAVCRLQLSIHHNKVIWNGHQTQRLRPFFVITLFVFTPCKIT